MCLLIKIGLLLALARQVLNPLVEDFPDRLEELDA